MKSILYYTYYFQTANDVQPRLNELKQRLLRSKQTFQPLIVAVGPVTNIQTLYVALNDQLYRVDAIVKAIELALAIFFSIDCKYPENTQTIWAFLQRVFTNTKLSTDVLNVESKLFLAISNIFCNNDNILLILFDYL